jgi:hypothetical protein
LRGDTADQGTETTNVVQQFPFFSIGMPSEGGF